MTVSWMCLFFLSLAVLLTDRIIQFADHGCSSSNKTGDPYKTCGEIPLPYWSRSLIVSPLTAPGSYRLSLGKDSHTHAVQVQYCMYHKCYAFIIQFQSEKLLLIKKQELLHHYSPINLQNPRSGSNEIGKATLVAKHQKRHARHEEKDNYVLLSWNHESCSRVPQIFNSHILALWTKEQMK